MRLKTRWKFLRNVKFIRGQINLTTCILNRSALSVVIWTRWIRKNYTQFDCLYTQFLNDKFIYYLFSDNIYTYTGSFHWCGVFNHAYNYFFRYIYLLRRLRKLFGKDQRQRNNRRKVCKPSTKKPTKLLTDVKIKVQEETISCIS